MSPTLHYPIYPWLGTFNKKNYSINFFQAKNWLNLPCDISKQCLPSHLFAMNLPYKYIRSTKFYYYHTYLDTKTSGQQSLYPFLAKILQKHCTFHSTKSPKSFSHSYAELLSPSPRGRHSPDEAGNSKIPQNFI